jgi:hypothetical protein
MLIKVVKVEYFTIYINLFYKAAIIYLQFLGNITLIVTLEYSNYQFRKWLFIVSSFVCGLCTEILKNLAPIGCL